MMQGISRSEADRRLGLARGATYKSIRKGFEPLSDGSIDFDALLRWRDRNIIKHDPNKCEICGKEAYNHGKKYRRGLCREHFEIWKKERRAIVCSKCGRRCYIGDKISKIEHGSYICRECRSVRPQKWKQKENACRIKYVTCSKCGTVFIRRSRSIRQICSECKKNKSRHQHCVDCGEILATKKHASASHAVCDYCMYFRRKTYKLRTLLGIRDEQIIKKLAALDTLNFISNQIKERGKTWETERVKRQIKRLKSII